MVHARVRSVAAALLLAAAAGFAADPGTITGPYRGDAPIPTKAEMEKLYRNTWGLNLMISNDGFGFGGFYRRDFSPTVAGFVELSVGESKDDQEVDQYNPYTGASFAPGKLNRFMLVPLMFGAQYRLFEDEIVDNFRPYICGAVGPTMVYVMPYSNYTTGVAEPIDFFRAIGMGRPHYTVGMYLGAGANFGTERANMFGVNFRYYVTYPLSGEGIPSMIDLYNGSVISRKSSFGGFMITLNFGMSS
jgi:hypothetical protein